MKHLEGFFEYLYNMNTPDQVSVHMGLMFREVTVSEESRLGELE